MIREFIKEQIGDLSKSTLVDRLNNYGRKEFFEEQENKGFTTVRFGIGDWFGFMGEDNAKYIKFVDSGRVTLGELPDGMLILNSAERIRVVALWAFDGLSRDIGRVETFENIKVEAWGWPKPGPKIHGVFPRRIDFDAFVSEYNIVMGPELKLRQVNTLT